MKKNILLFLFLCAVTGMLALAYATIAPYLTLETIQNHRYALKIFVNEHYLVAVLLYIFSYTVAVAACFPLASIFTCIGGFLFNAFFAVIYANIAATTGAMICFLVVRHLLGRSMKRSYKQEMTSFNKEAKKNGVFYLLTARFVTLIPFFIVNIVAALSSVSLTTFIWTTSIGIIPGSVIFALAGQQLMTITSLYEVFSYNTLFILLSLGALALSPILLRKVQQRLGW